MTFYIDKECDMEFPFDIESVAKMVMEKALEYVNCPYDAEINLLITDNEGIRQYNRDYRNIDRETDVLSFPNVDYEIPGDFSHVEESFEDYFDPDSGRLLLGDMIISAPKVFEQAKAYGHSEKREFAFLIAHSMLHLCGYDHMEDEERIEMEKHQEAILNALEIRRDVE